MGEHPAPPDGRELQGVADEGDSPPSSIGQLGQLRQAGAAHHSRLVHQHRGPGRQVEAMVGGTLQAVLDQQLVEGVGVDPGVGCQHLGGSRRGGHAEHRSALGPQALDGGGEGRGLARPRRADGEDELAVPRRRLRPALAGARSARRRREQPRPRRRLLPGQGGPRPRPPGPPPRPGCPAW